LDFDRPATLLFGANGCGKSSTLNAVEWALFGDECAGKQTGIRERVAWPIANCHMEAPDVLVEVELEGLGGTHVVRRTLKRSGRKSAVEYLELTLPEGEVVAGPEARERLAQLLRCSFRDFMTTVYQHQEAIRAVLTQEPRDRNDAIDRLLGLADYRNLLDAIKGANPRGWHRDLSARFEAFEGKVLTALETRESDLDERREEAAAAGVPYERLNEKAALWMAAEVQQGLAAFARKAGIEAVSAETSRMWTDLEAFEKATRTEINRLRGELPDLQEQQDLFNRQGDLAALKGTIEKARCDSEEIGRSIRELDIEYGGRQAVDVRIGEVGGELEGRHRRLREANARASLVRETIKYLEKEDTDALAGRCPLCEGPAPNLLQTLRRQWEASLQAQVAAIEKEINSFVACRADLEKVAGRYRGWDEKLAGHAQKLTEHRQKVSELLGRPLADNDDPLVLLNCELSGVGRRLKELAGAVRAKQVLLDEIAGGLEKVRLVREILQLEEKKKMIERIQESPEYKQLEALRDQAAELVADVEGIKDAISGASHEEARDKLSAAEATIDRYFRRLTRHPAVTRFRLAVSADARTGRNSYDLTDQNGMDLAPVLSQGDLNALALAMFLGLACSAEGAGAFGFVMLDDPSQSLGSEHKEQLVAVLNEVAASKQLLLATMDREFRDCWRQGLGKAKTEYLFEGWTPENGPTISRR
jgi:DNA repair exonuclease SbcCD ATPase subunit